MNNKIGITIIVSGLLSCVGVTCAAEPKTAQYELVGVIHRPCARQRLPNTGLPQCNERDIALPTAVLSTISAKNIQQISSGAKDKEFTGYVCRPGGDFIPHRQKFSSDLMGNALDHTDCKMTMRQNSGEEKSTAVVDDDKGVQFTLSNFNNNSYTSIRSKCEWRNFSALFLILKKSDQSQIACSVNEFIFHDTNGSQSSFKCAKNLIVDEIEGVNIGYEHCTVILNNDQQKVYDRFGDIAQLDEDCVQKITAFVTPENRNLAFILRVQRGRIIINMLIDEFVREGSNSVLSFSDASKLHVITVNDVCTDQKLTNWQYASIPVIGFIMWYYFRDRLTPSFFMQLLLES